MRKRSGGRARPLLGCCERVLSVAMANRHVTTGNLKTAILGTIKHVAKRYVAYLAEFQCRFNRRTDLPAMIADLSEATARARSRPRAKLTLAYVAG